MVRRLVLIGVFAFAMISTAAYADRYDVPNIQVSVQADDAVKARDQALLEAERQALAALVGRSIDQIANISDLQINHLLNTFSVQGERVTSKSYTAMFDIHFDPNRTQIFVQSNSFDIVDQSSRTTPIVAQAAQPVQPKSIVVLPVLDIGAREVVWDDPNIWRDVWQRKDYSTPMLMVHVPLGDVSDVGDVPDTGFLTGKTANITDLLARYNAQTLYTVVVKNQGAALDPSDGMVLSIYKSTGKDTQLVKKTSLHSRPGYAFDDAAPAALNIIAMAENGTLRNENTATNPSASVAATTPALPLSTDGSQRITVTVPYQSLGQWVSIQRHLRNTPNVRSILPSRVSPSSATVTIVGDSPMAQLAESLKNNGFQLQQMPNGETALIGQ